MQNLTQYLPPSSYIKAVASRQNSRVSASPPADNWFFLHHQFTGAYVFIRKAARRTLKTPDMPTNSEGYLIYWDLGEA
jgi:hypothetical protein